MLLTSIVTFAQTPNQFKYQAVLRDGSGNILANENVTVDISILQSDLTTSVFEETHTTQTNSQGLINLNIGANEDLSVVDWSADEYFIEININGTIMGTSQLLSVPYALHSKTAENVINDEVEDADADPVNEIQTLLLENNNLSISNGNSVILPTVGDVLQTLTTEQRNALQNVPQGKIIYNIDKNKIEFYTGNLWITLAVEEQSYPEILLNRHPNGPVSAEENNFLYSVALNQTFTFNNYSSSISDIDIAFYWHGFYTGMYALLSPDEANAQSLLEANGLNGYNASIMNNTKFKISQLDFVSATISEINSIDFSDATGYVDDLVINDVIAFQTQSNIKGLIKIIQLSNENILFQIRTNQ